MLENLVRVIAGGELRHCIMHGLIGLVLQLQSHDGQAVEKEREIYLPLLLARYGCSKIEMRTEGDPVLGIALNSGTLGGARFWIEQAKLQPAHLQAVA